MGRQYRRRSQPTGIGVISKSIEFFAKDLGIFPLMLLGCAGKLNVYETRNSLKMLYFVDGPEDGFWQGEPLSSRGARLGWIRFKPADEAEPLLFDAGQDGYYFELDVHFGGDLLAREPSFAICPTKNAAAQQCPHFSLRGIREAVTYVCNRKLN